MINPLRATTAAILLLFAATSQIQARESLSRCMWTSEHDGKREAHISSVDTVTANETWFAGLRARYDNQDEGWRGYRWITGECIPLDDQEAAWHLFVSLQHGFVSLQHGLTEAVCHYILRSLNPRFVGMRMVSPSDFRRGECFK